MHELSVCLALIEQVEAIASEHRAVRVERIVVRVGPLSGVEPALLRNAYPLAAAGTVAEAAELAIEDAPLIVRCNACGEQTEARPSRLLCGRCTSNDTRLVSGDELLLAHVELAVAGDTGAAGQ